MHHPCRRAIAGIVCSLLLAPLGAQPREGAFTQPVSLMVPYPAGSASDFTARTMQEPLAHQLGVPVVVENLGGAAGAIAANKVLAAAADGQQLFQGSPNELILSGLVNKGVKYQPDDFRMVAPVAISHLVVIAQARLPADNLDQLAELARARRSEPLNYGSSGPGTMYHLLGELASRRVGAPMTHVPYKGGAPLMQDLIGGLIDFAFVPYQSSYADLARQGRIKVIGSLADARLPAPFQNVQSYRDTQNFKDFSFSIWTGYLVKRGTPQRAVEQHAAALQAALKLPQVRSPLEAQAKTLFAPMSLEQAATFYRNETARYRELVKTVGFEPQ
ncbi:tripartite-type tricarboxylate transporter receptor subunit TctC [Acidovorax soli]|uniref:Tripartite-type tricarboxylate transporter receptor subunit TctC n=1 Tax=Acidovorax soli TaxID=592050 RepID=A0A7X0PHL8_9BURK|nr:tripartite tricarboxylate transporter substrate binding protein [Acidovorax soli]MBB6562046.1 tripartite-type tricarboxylate transporter receptor subunit TctC [Acidovorax soli]